MMMMTVLDVVLLQLFYLATTMKIAFHNYGRVGFQSVRAAVSARAAGTVEPTLTRGN